MGQRMNWVNSMVNWVNGVNSMVNWMDHRVNWVNCMVNRVDRVNGWMGQNLGRVRGWGSGVGNSLVFHIGNIATIADRVSAVSDHLGPAIGKGHPIGTRSASSI